MDHQTVSPHERVRSGDETTQLRERRRDYTVRVHSYRDHLMRGDETTQLHVHGSLVKTASENLSNGECD